MLRPPRDIGRTNSVVAAHRSHHSGHTQPTPPSTQPGRSRRGPSCPAVKLAAQVRSGLATRAHSHPRRLRRQQGHRRPTVQACRHHARRSTSPRAVCGQMGCLGSPQPLRCPFGLNVRKQAHAEADAPPTLAAKPPPRGCPNQIGSRHAERNYGPLACSERRDKHWASHPISSSADA